jgi:tetratricopeptide (TPR) repeat protein
MTRVLMKNPRAVNRMSGNRNLPFATFLLLAFSCALFPLRRVEAQTRPATRGASIQQLYGEAQAAEARGDLAGAARRYEKILQIDPRIAPAYNNLGAVYVKEREFPKAVAVLEKGLKIAPSMTSASALLGIALYAMQEYARARAPLETALRAHPGDDNAEMLLANDLIKLGDYAAASIHLRRLAAREPRNQHVWYLLGQVYTQLAEQSYAKVDSIDPNSVLSHEIRGDVMSSMKNYLGALLEYKKAVELGPHQPGTHYKLGNAYWNLNDWAAATEQFQAEIANDPANCEAWWKLGDILLQQHMDPQQAFNDVNKGLTLCPGLSDARLDRARALILLNQPAKALPDLEATEKTTPDEPIVHFLLSQAYRRTGHLKQAESEMEVFAKLEQSEHAKAASRTQQLLKLRNAGRTATPHP